MPDLESDARLFSLWPLSRMIQETGGIVFDRTVTPPRMEIAFGDFLIDSHRFHQPGAARAREKQKTPAQAARYTTEPGAAAPPVDESVYRLELWATTEAFPVKTF